MNVVRAIVLITTCFASTVFAKFIPIRVAANANSTCAVSTDGELKCWGDNSKNTLGTENYISYGAYPNTMGVMLPAINLGTGVKAVDVCIGELHRCIATSDGRVKCWGDNTHGALGHGDAAASTKMGDALPFTDLGTNFKAQRVSCGVYHSCALSTDGRVKCWGDNSGGCLGIGFDGAMQVGSRPGEMGNALPVLPVQKPITALATGEFRTCVTTADGARCWGDQSYGPVLGQENRQPLGNTPETAGDNIPTISLEAKNVPVTVTGVSASFSQMSCALYQLSSSNNTRVKCWGKNEYGQLGIGNSAEYGGEPNTMGANLPVVDLGLDDILDLQSYLDSTCVLTRSGRVKCWGNNLYGQLGLGDMDIRGDLPGNSGRNIPDVDLGLPATGISSGMRAHNVCAILINHRLKCWGTGSYGQLGNESTTPYVGIAPNQMGDDLQFVRLD